MDRDLPSWDMEKINDVNDVKESNENKPTQWPLWALSNTQFDKKFTSKATIEFWKSRYQNNKNQHSEIPTRD